MIDALLDRGHTPYRQIGHRAVSQVMDRCGIAYTQAEVEWLVGEIESLKPFPDVVAALGRLARRYKLVILSNGDRDMLEAAKPHIGFAFDLTISVQEAGYFKPHHATYATAETLITSAMAGDRARELHLRRQSRLRLHRRQGARLPLDLHRPPPPSLRAIPAPARFDRRGLQGTGRSTGAGLIEAEAKEALAQSTLGSHRWKKLS